jgi:RNA-directed DNA polymerase
MKESHREGVASHPVPESCVASRKAGREALTGAHAGGTSSCEISGFGVPTSSTETEGHTDGSANASFQRTPRSQRTQACMETPCARTGRPQQRPSRYREQAGGRRS